MSTDKVSYMPSEEITRIAAVAKLTGHVDRVEILFHWDCPRCGHSNDDSVNPCLGPWVSVICGDCLRTIADDSLDRESYASWERAREAAGRIAELVEGEGEEDER